MVVWPNIYEFYTIPHYATNHEGQKYGLTYHGNEETTKEFANSCRCWFFHNLQYIYLL